MINNKIPKNPVDSVIFIINGLFSSLEKKKKTKNNTICENAIPGYTEKYSVSTILSLNIRVIIDPIVTIKNFCKRAAILSKFIEKMILTYFYTTSIIGILASVVTPQFHSWLSAWI